MLTAHGINAWKDDLEPAFA